MNVYIYIHLQESYHNYPWTGIKRHIKVELLEVVVADYQVLTI